LDSSNDEELATSEWSLDADRRINPSGSFFYRGKIFVDDVEDGCYETEVFWDDVPCPS